MTLWLVRKGAINAAKQEVIRIQERKKGGHKLASNSSISTSSHVTHPDDTHSDTPPVPRHIGPPIRSNRVRAEKTFTAIQEAQEMLENREQEMTREIAQVAREAKILLREQNRPKALRRMKKKKRLEIQSKEISNQIDSLECHKEAVTNALAVCDTLDTIQRGIDEARPHHHGNEAVTELDRLLDRVQAEIDVASSNNGAPSPNDSARGRSDEFDEAELLRELMQQSRAPSQPIMAEAVPVFEDYAPPPPPPSNPDYHSF